MHWCSIKHPDLASYTGSDRSSTYTANFHGDNMPLIKQPFVMNSIKGF